MRRACVWTHGLAAEKRAHVHRAAGGRFAFAHMLASIAARCAPGADGLTLQCKGHANLLDPSVDGTNTRLNANKVAVQNEHAPVSSQRRASFSIMP